MTFDTNGSNAVVAVISGTPAYFYAYIEKTDISLIASITLPIIFFCVGKAVDVAVKLYLERNKK